MAQQTNVFYKGEEKKFAVSIRAAGFDMDTMDFELEVTTPKAGDSVKVLKTGQPDERGRWRNADGSLLVFSEERQDAEPGESSSSWWAIVDTQYFASVGELKVIATAMIADAKAYDGIRKSIDVKTLGVLKNY